MAFLTPRSASNHIIFALGVDPTARDAGEGGGSDLVSQATPFAVSCGLVAVHVTSLHKSSSIKPHKTSSKCCRVCHQSLLLALQWLGGNSVTDVEYEGEILHHVAPQKLATCSACR